MEWLLLLSLLLNLALGLAWSIERFNNAEQVRRAIDRLYELEQDE